MKLCLDSLTLTDTEPVDLIRAARTAGFDMVSLWVQQPSVFPKQLVTPAKLQGCAAALAETGVEVGPLEAFDLSSAEAVKSYRPALELGARLGAKAACAINIRNPDPVVVTDLFAQFAELANECGLGTNLEPVAMLPTATLAQARDIIRAAGVDAGIVFDAFHLVRGGRSVADLRGLEPGLIRHVQLCDGELEVSPQVARYEVTHERLYPGDGAFPLVELFNTVATDISWGIEAPSRRRSKAGMSAEQQAVQAMGAMRTVIDKILSSVNTLR
jgi:sugar phosphate isomerase/epimerase